MGSPKATLIGRFVCSYSELHSIISMKLIEVTLTMYVAFLELSGLN